ncbi:MAG: NADH-quinone oxidoreductase subunit NuoK [Candidatus Aquicultorales bacterium]
MIPTEYFLMLAALIFLIGILGFLTRRSLIQALMCLELMLNSVNLVFLTLGNVMGDKELTGMVFALFSMVIAAAEIGMGLALVLLFFRKHGRADVDELNLLRG